MFTGCELFFRPGYLMTWCRAGSPPWTGSRPPCGLGLASSRARARHPGPVGELVVPEIWAYTVFGHRFDGTGVVPRTVTELLADAVSGPVAGS
ncbi:hypothetical protein [Pseudonocardia sp.]|uniref:hypothetical protein n=1 Tax=Pseudonocardia sp. TaxID=60912 RepID=UPI0026156238|nr:hypothetical protein [Pseudonocardia sp.]